MSLATVLATMCAKTFALKEQVLSQQDRVGVYIGSALPALDPAHQYETRGLKEGWALIDPFRLPHCIPSSLAASVAIHVGAKGFAFTCLDGHLASLRAIDRAATALCYCQLDQAFVGGAEEVSDLHLAALAGADFPDYASTHDNGNFSHIAEGASIGLLHRGAPQDAADGIWIEGYSEIVGELDQEDVQRFQHVFCELAEQPFDGVFSMFGQTSPGATILRAMLDRLGFRTEPHWLGDTYGDLHGAVGAIALASAVEEVGWSRALIHCSGRLETTGFLIVRKFNA